MGIIDEAREELKRTNINEMIDQKALDNALYEAIVRQKSLKALDAAIESGANVNTTQGNVKKRGFYFGTNLSPLEEVIHRTFKSFSVFGLDIDIALPMAESLIAAGAKTNKVLNTIIKTKDYCARNKWLDYLLNRTQDLRGLLHAAASADDWSTILTLIKKGADGNEIFHGDSPLHKAVENNSFEVIKALIKAGASSTQKNRDNLTAFDIALKNNHLKLAAYLTKHFNYLSWEDSAHRVQVDISNQLFRIANLIEIYLYANALQDKEDDEDGEDEEYE